MNNVKGKEGEEERKTGGEGGSEGWYECERSECEWIVANAVSIEEILSERSED